MLNGFKTQTIRAAEYGPDTAAELAATAGKRDQAREALAKLAAVADAIQAKDSKALATAQAKVRELVGCK